MNWPWDPDQLGVGALPTGSGGGGWSLTDQDTPHPVGAFSARIWASGSYPLTENRVSLPAMGCKTEFLHLSTTETFP